MLVLIHAHHFGIAALTSLAVLGLLAGCATTQPRAPRDYSSAQHYEMACDSASRDIDTLMVHWENMRSADRMPEFQITQARQAMRVIGPVCDNISAVETLDSVQQGRVQSAFLTLETLARNLPRLPAGS
jgi:hypothetical protein